MAIEIHIFENGTEGSERQPMLDLNTSSPAIAAMNLRALAAELDKLAAPNEPAAGNYGAGQPRARKQRSDAGTKRGPVVTAPVVAEAPGLVSPFDPPPKP